MFLLALIAEKGDHLADLKSPLNPASTITEDFLLEYVNSLPMEQVGWAASISRH
jgi:4-phytase/acid phosphatase